LADDVMAQAVTAVDLFRIPLTLEAMEDRNGDDVVGDAAGQVVVVVVVVVDADEEEVGRARAAVAVAVKASATRGRGESSSDLTANAPSMQRRTSDAVRKRNGTSTIRGHRHRQQFVFLLSVGNDEALRSLPML
jgi:hypothetical protein